MPDQVEPIDGRAGELVRAWGPQMLMSLCSALLAVGVFYGVSLGKWEKFDTGIKANRQVALQATEAAQAATTAVAALEAQRKVDLQTIKSAILGARISLAKSMAKTTKALTASQAEIVRRVDVQIAVTGSFESEMRRALERIRDKGPTP